MNKIVYRRQAVKDIPKIKTIRLSEKVQRLIDVIKQNLYQNPPPYEKLVGDLQGAYSRRINVVIKHQIKTDVFIIAILCFDIISNICYYSKRIYIIELLLKILLGE